MASPRLQRRKVNKPQQTQRTKMMTTIQEQLNGPQRSKTIDVPSIQVGGPQPAAVGRREQEQATQPPQPAVMGRREQEQAARKAPSNVISGPGYNNVRGAQRPGSGYDKAVKTVKKPGFFSHFFRFDQNGDGKLTLEDLFAWLMKLPALVANPNVQLLLPITIGVVGGYVNINAWIDAAVQSNANIVIAMLVWALFTYWECRHLFDTMTLQSRVAKLLRAAETPGLLPLLDELKTPEARRMMRDFVSAKRETTSTMSNFVTIAICLIEAFVVSNGRSFDELLNPFTAMVLLFTVGSVPLSVQLYGEIASRTRTPEQRAKVNTILDSYTSTNVKIS